MDVADLIGLADHPALEFLNTTATPARETIEMLSDGRSLLDWYRRAGLLDPSEADTVSATFDVADIDAAAADAVRLREWLRPVVATWATTLDHELPADVCARLNQILAWDQRFAQIHLDDEHGSVVRSHRRWHEARQLLNPVAEAAADLLTRGDRALVRQCDGPTCTLWFYDRTKSHRRRWCSMAVCGNRAKARNHRTRASAT